MLHLAKPLLDHSAISFLAWLGRMRLSSGIAKSQRADTDESVGQPPLFHQGFHIVTL